MCGMLQELFLRAESQVWARPVSAPPLFVPNERLFLGLGGQPRALLKVQTIEIRAAAQGDKRRPLKLRPL